MSGYRLLTVSRAGRIAHVGFHWPEPTGHLDADVLHDFERLVDWVDDEDPCDILVVRPTANPDADVSAPPPDLEQCRLWEKLQVRIDRLRCISVAAIDGTCVRFWMQLALACDHRIATARSTFQVLELKEGYLPGMNVFRLAKYAGIGVARRLAFTGERLAALDAIPIGLVDQVCPADELGPAVERFCRRLGPTPPMATQLARRLLNESFSTSFEQFLGQYLASQHRCLTGGPAAKPED